MSRVIDLTLEQYEGNATHPAHGRTPLMFRGPVSHGLTSQRGIKNPYDGSPVSAANEYIILTGHTGTHVDAPSHVDHLSTLSVERLPLNRTCGPAIWLDLSARCQPGAVMAPDDLARAERLSGTTIAHGDVVLIHTGWHDLPLENGGADRAILDGPYLLRESAEWLRERGISAVGVDMASPEGKGAQDLPVHMNFLRPRSLGLPDEAYILIYENLRNISKIRRSRFTFSGLPIPFRGSTGSPVRAVAFVD